jgi:cell division protease FtsH
MGKSLPNISYYDSSNQEYGFTKPYSEARARAIDEEVQQIIDEQYERAKELLNRYAEGHHELANLLQEREVIFAEDAEKIFGPRQWKSRTEEIISDEDNRQPQPGNTTVTPPPFDPQNDNQN